MEEGKRELPPIRDKDIGDNEPKVVCGKKAAALPPPTKAEEEV